MRLCLLQSSAGGASPPAAEESSFSQSLPHPLPGWPMTHWPAQTLTLCLRHQLFQQFQLQSPLGELAPPDSFTFFLSLLPGVFPGPALLVYVHIKTHVHISVGPCLYIRSHTSHICTQHVYHSSLSVCMQCTHTTCMFVCAY